MSAPPVLYLSGPMTGLPEYNYPAFDAAAARLRGLGYTVVNPAETNKPPTAPWPEFLRKDIVDMMQRCTAVALLPRWHLSRGARLECFIGAELGMTLALVDTWAMMVERPCDADSKLRIDMESVNNCLGLHRGPITLRHGAWLEGR